MTEESPTSGAEGAPGRLAHLIVDRPEAVVLAFLLLTAGIGAGLGQVSMAGGTGQFTVGSPSQDAYETVQQTFTGTFDVPTGSTLLVHHQGNALSKSALLETLAVLEELKGRPELRVRTTRSVAAIVARQLDPNANTVDAQRRAIAAATPSEIDAAIRAVADRSNFRSLVSEDFSAVEAAASTTVAVVTHAVPGRDPTAVGVTADAAVKHIQLQTREIVTAMTDSMTVYGSGIVAHEFSLVIVDSLQIVVPASLVLILALLFVAFRDLGDFVAGIVSLLITVVWTFGLMGWAGIAFSQLLIAVPPLLLGVGIDYGIHVINQYRERRTTTDGVAAAMGPTIRHLVVAFGLVTVTTVAGFAANLSSSLQPIRNFGLVAAIGIGVTFLVFGVFLPALKVLTDTVRGRSVSSGDQTALGREGTLLGSLLPVGVGIARRAPHLFIAVMLLTAGIAGAYGSGVDTSFSDEDFLPPADVPEYLEKLPGPLAPHTYTVTDTKRVLERAFSISKSDSITIYWETPLRSGSTLEEIQRIGTDPPDPIVTSGRRASSNSLLTVIDAYAKRSDSFARLVARNDRDGDGVPEENLGRIYEALLESPLEERARRYLGPEYRSTRITYAVEASATQAAVAAAAETLAGRLRGDADATGSTVIFHGIARSIYRSAIKSLLVALALTAAILALAYQWLFDDWTLGIVNLVPILLTVAFVLATMRVLGMKLNALTGTLLAVTIGMGVDYTVHVVHRFVEEFRDQSESEPALVTTMRGTGGALTGSMLTTTLGVGVLGLAITPILQTFGILTAISIGIAYLMSIVVTPSLAVLWVGFRKPS
ncbi:MAG: RND family transporter [Halodesulfurarchaeum sp.]